jgi:2-succinyl-5-enolpyruvyl-6-hydroxy-3-cyclohexene-1-carboxylate synthase
MSPPNNLAWAGRIVRALAEEGATRFFVSPGARCAPIAEAIARLGLPASAHFDERGAGFAAMGFAQASGQPAVCVTTSGSAVANLLPACVEAAMSGIPLVLLTADRPHELRGTGANQTIQQPGIFSHYVRAQSDFPCPEDAPDDFSTEGVVRRLMALARSPEPGPVHINLPFREPLLPENTSWHADPPPPPHESKISDEPPPRECVDPAFFDEPGVIVLGRMNAREQPLVGEIVDMARHIGWPLIADALSGARLMHGTVPHVDWILRMRGVPSPTRTLHMGGAVVSKALGHWMADSKNYLQVRQFPKCLDPCHSNPRWLQYCPIAFSRMVRTSIPARPPDLNNHPLARASAPVAALVGSCADSSWSEISLARLVAGSLTNIPRTLFLGNSMPVRDFDASTEARMATPCLVFGNRGASGIDGNIATIAGISHATNASILAVLGDMAVLHDLNSLSLLAGRQVTLVVVNNGGGQIFRLLPLSMTPRAMRDFVQTPHSFDFQYAAAHFRIKYAGATSCPELESLLANPPDGARLIECQFEAGANALLHSRISEALAQMDFVS